MTTRKITLNKLYSLILKGNNELKEEIKVENVKTYGLLHSQMKSLEEKINNLPTKEEHFNKMDEVVTELQRIRDEQVGMEGRVSKLEDQSKN